MTRIFRAAFAAFLMAAVLAAGFGAAADTVTNAQADPAMGAESADPVERILQNMTLEEKVGQMFFATCPSKVSSAVKAAQNYQLGGYVLYAYHFKNETPDSVRENIQKYQDASSVPMLIAVDEEGGTVTRVSSFKAFRSSRFQSPMKLYQKGGMDLIRSDAREKAELLLSLGINVNLAPIADVPEKKGDFIYSRSMGTDPVLTSEFITAVVEESNKAGIGLMLKHFPGYGNNKDTHAGEVIDKRPLETFETRDFLPFEAGAKAGVGAVMVSHNIVECFDAQYPASLTPLTLQALRALGFDGVAATDGLDMKAVKKYFSTSQAVVMAVQAGNDMMMMSKYKEGIEGILAAVADGRILESRIDESVRRILKWKQALGLIPAADGAETGAGESSN